jgi:predicted  nucleic acid-binding Zn-ribbon protein
MFEWYDNENDKNSTFQIHDESSLDDAIIEDGIKKLAHNYRSYNIADIYDEMESIREEIRQGNAVDLQQIEQRVVALFDKLEERMEIFQDKHNSLASRIGDEIDDIESKLIKLQSSIDKLSKKPSKIEAFSSDPADPQKVFSQYYEYLSKPKVVISPTGHITIDFSSDWMQDDRENFLKDMRAKAISKSKK